MERRLWPLALAVVLLGGCPSEEDECTTTADCFDKGLVNQQCVNGTCAQSCATDTDCKGIDIQCESGDSACEQEQKTIAETKFVCQNLVCVAGCPNVACGAGESCSNGRCAFYSEGFEAPSDGAMVTLESLGFNKGLDMRDNRNSRAKVVWTGVDDCGVETPRDRCAGPAGDGKYFLAVERNPTSERGTLTFGTTCRACSCCLECRDPLVRTSTASACPGVTLPDVELCTSDVNPACTAICNECEQCTAEITTLFDETALTSCEQPAARRGCSSCVPHDQCLLDKKAENRACPGGTYPSCAMAPTNQAECDACLIAECASFEEA